MIDNKNFINFINKVIILLEKRWKYFYPKLAVKKCLMQWPSTKFEDKESLEQLEQGLKTFMILQRILF
ncbi:MAG: hypothetical protein QXX41_04000 [Nitrososphaerota archaeon]